MQPSSLPPVILSPLHGRSQVHLPLRLHQQLLLHSALLRSLAGCRRGHGIAHASQLAAAQEPPLLVLQDVGGVPQRARTKQAGRRLPQGGPAGELHTQRSLLAL